MTYPDPHYEEDCNGECPDHVAMREEEKTPGERLLEQIFGTAKRHTTCGYQLNPCPECGAMIGHDGYNEHQCAEMLCPWCREGDHGRCTQRPPCLCTDSSHAEDVHDPFDPEEYVPPIERYGNDS